MAPSGADIATIRARNAPAQIVSARACAMIGREAIKKR
jgi:hypothetical protein